MFGEFPLIIVFGLMMIGLTVALFSRKNKLSVWGWIITLYSVSGLFLMSGYSLTGLIQNPNHTFVGYFAGFLAIIFTLAMIIKRPRTSV